ncbi:Ig-like domain repeat protein [Roseateles flavus]|uniref:Ig-like domain repeat protein n=1 Tax=Roseateles flavus TaxID=3149041 RepID=A0ABV0GKJ3_9BURK
MSSLNPSYVSQATTLTATVTPLSATGTVTFKSGTTVLGSASLDAGKAVLSTSFSTSGTSSLTAVYAGNGTYASSTSAAISQVIKAKATSTTVLSSGLNPSATGQSLNLTAKLTPSTATGMVTFKDGAAVLGTGSLSAGTATLTTSFAAAGTHVLTAIYVGDSANAASTSPGLNQVVKAATSTTLSSSINPSFLGQSVVLTARLAPVTATGSVTFKNGATTLGTATLSSGVATLTTSFGIAGNASVTAVYAGDAANAASTSAVLSQAVNAKATTATTIGTSLSPSYVSQPLTLTATVSPSTATGTVTFKDGSTNLGTGTLSGGVATLSTSFSSAGTHSVTASYAGDVGNGPSISTSIGQVVNAKVATTTTLASELNPSYVNQPVTLKATVSPSATVGTVTFKDGATTLGTSAINSGIATLTTSFTITGARSIKATYDGNVSSNASTSAALTQTVKSKATSSVTLDSVFNAYVGEVFTIYPKVDGAFIRSGPMGTLTLYDSGVAIASVPTRAGSQPAMSVTFDTAGAHRLTAVFSGDDANLSSSSAAFEQVVRAKRTPVTVSFSSSLTPSATGQNVTLTATLLPSTATGNVVFRDSEYGNLSVDTSSAGVAKHVHQFSTARSYSLTAYYVGDETNAPSSSPVLVQEVLSNSSSTTLVASPASLALRQPTTFIATVSPPSLSGSVTFKDGAMAIGTAPLVGGAASYTTGFSASGTHSVTATYAGDGVYGASVSSPVVVTVSCLLTLSSSADTIASGAAITLTASLEGTALSGTIGFVDGSTALGNAPISANKASLAVTLGTAGLHSLRAIYSGDGTNAPCSSEHVAVQVNDGGSGGTGAMTWIYGYDPSGNRWADVDPKGNAVSRDFDTLHRLVQIDSPPPSAGSISPSVRMRYDEQGNLVAVNDPRGLETTYSVDGLSNYVEQASPDTGNSGMSYDSAGNLLARTDSRGKITNFTYDMLGRLKSATYASGMPTVFEYDGGGSPVPYSKGRLTGITDESGSTSYTYDYLGHVLTKTQVIAGKLPQVLRYSWGTSGPAAEKLTAITYPSGLQVNYTYDTAGRINALTANPVNANGVGTNTGVTVSILSSVTYNGANEVTGWTWANGTAYQRTYDGFGRLVSYPLGNPNGSGTAAGMTRTLQYDPAGLILGYVHSNAAGPQAVFDQGFSYDNLGRLTAHTLSGASYGYSYDLTGNRTQRTLGGTGYTVTTSPTSNRISQAQAPGGTQVFNYDNAGNTLADGTVGYSYSDRGRMNSATVAGGKVSFLYNGLEQRVAKTGPTALVPSGASYYVYDEAGRLVGEYDANQAPLYETVYLGSMPVAVLKQTGTAASSTLSNVAYNVYSDHLGAPRVITRSADETIVWRWDGAEAFGASAADQSPAGLGVFAFNQRFPGQLLDVETGSFYNWNRDYRPDAGRYIESDPIGLSGGINTYTYVAGNPVSSVDPDGRIGLPGALIGAGLEIGKEMLIDGRSARCVDIGAVLTAATFGALSPGFISLGKSAAGMALPSALAGFGFKELAIWQGTLGVNGALIKKALAAKSWTIGDDCECKK